jgi:glycine cleavage system H protein
METVRFRHAHFSARFPVGYRYAASHFWLHPADAGPGSGPADPAQPGRWRVGFTKFATRMLGEPVSDLFCVADGMFLGTNPALTSEACLTHSSPYSDGWLYEVDGLPQASSLDVHQYVAMLEQTIDRLHASRYDGGGDTTS